MLAERGQESLQISRRAHALAQRLWRTERSFVLGADTGLSKCRCERGLREALPAGIRQLAHIDHPGHASGGERLQKRIQGRPFVADGQDVRPSFGCRTAGPPRP
jgi:hypothetical protein